MSDATPITMDIQRILSILPHRYPFLLVDRVLECVPGSHIKAYKNVTINEPFFQGHFPGAPGDRLELHCDNIRMKLKLCKMDARAYVDGKLAAEAQITAAIGDRPKA